MGRGAVRRTDRHPQQRDGRRRRARPARPPATASASPRSTTASNEGWYHAYFFGKRDLADEARTCTGRRAHPQHLHQRRRPQGSAGARLEQVPVAVRREPRSSTASASTSPALPGGRQWATTSATPSIHETGHWLGLLHTFQGGCEGNGRPGRRHPGRGRAQLLLRDHAGHLHGGPGPGPGAQLHGLLLDACMNSSPPVRSRGWTRLRQVAARTSASALLRPTAAGLSPFRSTSPGLPRPRGLGDCDEPARVAGGGPDGVLPRPTRATSWPSRRPAPARPRSP